MLEVNRIGSSEEQERFMRDAGLTLLKNPTEEDAPQLTSARRLSLLLWGEHCTECAAPDCHDTCDLYEAAQTGFCRRFFDGIVIRISSCAPLGYEVDVIYKRWARLLAVGNSFVVGRQALAVQSKMAFLLSRLMVCLQKSCKMFPPRIHWRISDKLRGMVNYYPRAINRAAGLMGAVMPDFLLLIAGNPHSEAYQLELSISGFETSQSGRSWRKVIVLKPGWNEVSIPISDIVVAIDVRQLHRICILNVDDEPRMLQLNYCGYIQGVKSAQTDRKVKLAAFDLDNTLWDGVLLEDDNADRVLCDGVLETIKELDRRGILLTVISKNNVEDVQPILERMNLWQYFLYPAINWEPKSSNLQKVVSRLNIGMDAVVFIDDSEFERAEVLQNCVGVRVFDAAELVDLPKMDCFDVPVTEESARRKNYYQAEEKRNLERVESKMDYEQFLHSCMMKISLENYSDVNSARVQELVQRTNQLNFSGTHYSAEELDEMLNDSSLTPVVIKGEDKYGEYGIIGFALISKAGDSVLVKDMMFSCRIQGKMVEYAFIDHLAEQVAAHGVRFLACMYKKTKRNAHSAKIFKDMQMKEAGDIDKDGRQRFVLDISNIDECCYPVEVVDDDGISSSIF